MNSRRCCSSRIRRPWAFDSYRRLVSPVATATLGCGDETVILMSRVELDCSEWAGCPKSSQDVQVGFGKQSRIQSSPGASVGHSSCGGGGRNGVQFGRDNGQGGGLAGWRVET